MKNLIITGANTRYYDHLLLFLDSLRKKARFQGEVAVCDNMIEGSWDQPQELILGGSFTKNQRIEIESYGATIFVLSDLLRENSVEYDVIREIPTGTQRLPYKFLYTALISKKYFDKVAGIAYFDCDVYFQKRVSGIFQLFGNRGIYMSKELFPQKYTGFTKRWLDFCSYDKLSSQKLLIDSIVNQRAYCSGFYGGQAASFHKFSLLCLLLSSNRFTGFFSDQPLINIVHYFYEYNIHQISDRKVMHLGDYPEDYIFFIGSRVCFKHYSSCVVHLNGGHTKQFASLIKENKESYSYAKHQWSYVLKLTQKLLTQLTQALLLWRQ